MTALDDLFEALREIADGAGECPQCGYYWLNNELAAALAEYEIAARFEATRVSTS